MKKAESIPTPAFIVQEFSSPSPGQYMRHKTCMPRIYFKDRLKNISKIFKLDPLLILLPEIVNIKLLGAGLSAAGIVGASG